MDEFALERGFYEGTDVDSLSTSQVQGAIEAMLFAHGDPLTPLQIGDALGLDDGYIHQVLLKLAKNYDHEERGIHLVQVAGGWQLITKACYLPFLRNILSPVNARYKLSTAALETMAIIAYRQPITRAEVETIRGVKAEKAINTLMALELIFEVGRREGVGRPILYGTTERFLNHFGLKSLDDLPKKPELPKL